LAGHIAIKIHGITSLHSSVPFIFLDLFCGFACPFFSLNWNKITQPKYLGGLGIRKSAHINACYMAKHKWNFLTQDSKISSKILFLKYGKDLNKKNRNQSYIRRGINKDFNIFNKGLKMSILNGRKTSFWFDNWLPNGALCNRIQGPLPLHVLSTSVHDILRSDRYRSDLISFNLPNDILNEIIATPYISNNNLVDIPIWGPSPNGIFSIKSAYKTLTSTLPVYNSLTN